MNFSYTTNPGYWDLVYDTYRAIRWHYRPDNWDNYTIPYSFVHDVRRFYNSPHDEILPVIYITVLFTLARYAFEIFICKVT